MTYDRSTTRTINGKGRAGRLVLRGAASAAAVAALAVVMSGTASAQPVEDDTVGNVEVSSSIALTFLSEDFWLTGVPGATVLGDGAVSFNVQTNNLAGYSVTVQSETATMTPAAVGNTDAIPISALSVRDGDATVFTPVSSTAPTTVHTQATRSADGGDALVNDYQVVIPFVNADTYSATLNYIAATL